jgi:hypothetical protein
MSTESPTAVPFADHLPPDVRADLEAVVAAVSTGKPVDPAVRERVRAGADRTREAVYRRHGLLDIGVPAIRELRDAE